MSDFAQLMKVDRRKQWKGLKEKHKEAIKKSKVDFDQKLGPALDKYQTQVEKLTALAGKGALNSNQVDPVFVASQALKAIVKSYHGSVMKLDEAAKKEMGALLNAIEGDIKSWEELAVKSMGTPSQNLSAGQVNGARNLIPILDNVRSMCLMIVQRGPRAVQFYKTTPPKPRLQAAALASELVEAGRLAGSAAHELANMAQQVVKTNTNYDLFKSRAEAAVVLIQKALNAAQVFHSKWQINDDPAMTICGDVDAATLNSNWQQIEADFGNVVNQIRKLP